MATTERENSLGFVDDRRTPGSTSLPGNLAVDARYLTVANLRSTLNTRQPATFTTAYLDIMTKNDMVMALRSLDDAGGIN